MCSPVYCSHTETASVSRDQTDNSIDVTSRKSNTEPRKADCLLPLSLTSQPAAAAADETIAQPTNDTCCNANSENLMTQRT